MAKTRPETQAKTPQVLTSRKTTPTELTREGLRHLYRTDLYALARRALYPTVKTPMTREFHQHLCQWRQTTPYSRNLYLLSRDHLKTSLLTVAGNVQRIIKDAQTRILLASNKAESAEAQLFEIKGHLQSELLIWLYPEILYADPYKEAEQWATGQIIVKRKRWTKEATVETIGAEGAVTGKHYDHGQFDDLVDEQNSKTRDQLEKVIHWYKTTQSLFEPDATQEIVGTPWAFGDLYDWLIGQKLKREFKIGVYRQPCWKTEEQGVLRVDARGGISEDLFIFDAAGQKIPAYPEKHTRESLEERERTDSLIFASQWLLRPVDDASAVFPRSKAVIVPRDKVPDPNTLWVVMCVDPAISTRQYADYSAIAVAGFDHHGLMYVLDLRRGRWTDDELLDQTFRAFQRYPMIRVIGWEAVAFQKIYLRLLAAEGEKRRVYLPVTKLERDNKVGKPLRIRTLQPFWVHGEIILPADLPALDDFLEEAERFRTYKESLHDDMLDALADCMQLRVRPEPQDPDAEFDDEEADRRRFERQMRQENPAIDKAGLRNSWQMKRRREIWQEARDAAVLSAGPLSEFYSN